MLLHACGGRLGGLQEPPGASQGPPGGSRGCAVLNEKCARRVPPKPRTLGEAEISRVMVRLDLRRVCKGE